MTKKKPMGRPTIPKEERRTEILQIRLTITEKLEIERCAQGKEKSVPDWLREKLFG